MKFDTDSLYADVAIVGGGVMGSAIAFFIASSSDFEGTIVVIEKDLTYSDSSTARSLGSIRQQFSTPENVNISKFSFQFLSEAGPLLRVEDSEPEINLIKSSYLILASTAGLEQLKAAHSTQLNCDVDVKLFDKQELSEKFPWLNTDDIEAGCQGVRDEGWFDPYSLLTALKKKAQSLGVRYMEDEVASIGHQSNRISSVELKSQNTVNCGILVNAAGARSGKVAEMSGIHLPVSPRKRCVFVFKAAYPVKGLPLVADPAGIYVRPEGDCFLCGWTPSDNHPDPIDESLDVDYEIFEEILWPALAHRIPQFEAIRMTHAWAGHYDFNAFDQNGILGYHPEFSNYFMATGFSGHGIQQAPAIGRAMSELIIHGRYTTLDLSNLNYERILTNTKYEELNII